MSIEARISGLRGEISRLSKRIKKLESSINRMITELIKTMQDVPRILLCRDLMAHVKTAERLAKTLAHQIEAQEALLKQRLDRLAVQLANVDERLAKELAGVLAVILDLVKKIRTLKDNASFDSINEEARREALRVIEERRKIAKGLIESIERVVSKIRSEREYAHRLLRDYSIKSVEGRPVLLYVAVARVTVNDADYTRVFDGGLGVEPEVSIDGVDRDILELVYRELSSELRAPLTSLFQWFLSNRVYVSR